MVALDQWLSSPAGQYFVRKEQAWIDSVVPDLFGLHAVQLGTRQVDGLRENRIPHKAYVQDLLLLPQPDHSTDAVDGRIAMLSPDCYANYEDLPFDSQSLDLLVLPHVLEFSTDPHQLLREVERVLMPEGRVLITGFNPLSLWGLRHWAFKRWSTVWPTGCQPIHLSRLKDWLKLLSLEPEFGRFGCYRFPSFTEAGLARMGFMEHAGDRWWPVCGGVYLICAVKRVRGMRLIGPAFKDKALSVKQLKPVANKVSTMGAPLNQQQDLS
ncbi:class I SAM-dependent methyltransferase [Limnobacter sp.]|uniref:class I SAM-dependent methyltransferase n=1 Tax=Limnobacter sp. TaxID=2003368 RepID=UPI0039C907E2